METEKRQGAVALEAGISEQGDTQAVQEVCSFPQKVYLKQVANETEKTVYHLKHGLLADYLWQQLKSPAFQITFA